MRARVRFARDGSTGIIESGFLLDKNGSVTERLFLSFCFVVITDGHGTYIGADGTTSQVGSGDLLVVVPNERHGYGSGGCAGWNEVFLSATGPLVDAMYHSGIFAPSEGGRIWRNLSPIQLRKFSAIADDFLVCGTDDGCLLARLHLWFADLTAANEDNQGWLAQAQKLLTSDPHLPLSAPQVATAIDLPYDRFRRAFRQAVGVSATTYRLQARIAAAKGLLVAKPDSTLAEIATATGFCSAFQFSRMFKRLTGTSPQAFRRS